MKKGKGGVESFTDADGVKHLPGDIVDLPGSYRGEKWLEPVDEPKKPKPLPSKVESAPETLLPEVPIETPAAPLTQKKARRSK